MDKLSMCRICLVKNVRMYVVASRQLQETFEKLTDVPFIIEDRPMLACFFCYAKLKQCSEFHRKCKEAENVLAQLLKRDYVLQHKELSDVEYFGGLRKSPVIHINVGKHGTKVLKYNIKRKNVTVHEAIEANCLKLENVTFDYSDSDDIVPKIELNTDVEDVTLQKKQDNKLNGTPAAIKLKIWDEQFGNTHTTPVKSKINRLHISKTTDSIDISNIFKSDELKNHITITPLLKYEFKSCTKKGENINDNTKEVGYKCDVCHRCFTKKSYLDTHTQNCTHTGEKNLECGICRRCFSNKSNLRRHIRTHTAEKEYKCNICQRYFTERGNLNRHIREHSGVKPYECNICQRSYTQKSSLITHTRQHTGEKRYKCNVCQRYFSVLQNLNIHMRKHTGEKPFQCHVCAQRFTQISALKIHFRKHTGEKPYKCDLCQRRFIQSSLLKLHIRKHTGERPYKCDLCHRCFSSKPNLQRHILMHTGVKPYKCTICQRSFIQKCSLETHIRTHTGEKPFQCNICLRSFTDRSTLGKHVRTHAREKPIA